MTMRNALKTRFVRERLDAFRSSEDGSLISFSLFVFLAMLMFGGIAIDLMIYENKRVHLQNSTDRAVLAAANLDQTVDAKTVVQDWLAKSGINIDKDDVTVTEVGTFPLITGRQVSIDVDSGHDTLLMNLVGVENLPFGAISEATEAINDIEISLVLDVSGSMGQKTKLPDLKKAATDFVTDILGTTSSGTVSISLVPYSTQVSAGKPLLDAMNISQRHDRSHCVNFDGSDFSSVSINHSSALKQTAHFDPWKRYNNDTGGSNRIPVWFVCRNESHFNILPWTNNAVALNNQINAMTAGGNTSIDVAVKWGAALLDPSMNPQLNAMIANPAVTTTPAIFADRPFAYNRDDTLKFIIVMTDGINTTQYYLKDSYKTGMSNVWKDPSTGRLSRKSGNYYYHHHDRDWESQPYPNSSTAVQLSWPDVWAEMSMSYRAYQLYYRDNYDADDYYDNLYGPRSTVSASMKDSRLDTICSAAKAQNVVIFTIGFEVTDASAAVMKKCASTDSHFYRVNDKEIETAFASIANQINQLKLTQ